MRSDIINENSNNYGGNAEGLVKIPDAATYTCLAADSGKIHSVPDLTAHCTISLPAEEKGSYSSSGTAVQLMTHKTL